MKTSFFNQPKKDMKIELGENIKMYVDYVPSNNLLEPFCVYVKNAGILDFTNSYVLAGTFKTIDEAEEYGLSRAKNVQYLGIYENGKKKGVTGWYSDSKPKITYQFRPENLSSEVEIIKIKRKSQIDNEVFFEKTYRK